MNKGTRTVVGNFSLSLDGRISGPGGEYDMRWIVPHAITLCPEIAGGGARLFEDGLPPSSWTLQQSTVGESGALCLIYERIRTKH